MRASSFFRSPQNAVAISRDVRKVPFVELFNGRLQGVVSSGSDIARVYVSFLEAGTGDYYCSTNNNRPCGGLRGTPCKHIRLLVGEAVAQFGIERISHYLRLPGETPAPASGAALAVQVSRHLAGSPRKEPAGEVFSRFLNYLRLLELPASMQPVMEMHWFV